MKALIADSSSDLLQKLAAIDIAVPPRAQNREKDHCQQWSICRFLSTFADSALIQYPLHVDPRDRPDFLLSMDKTKVGIEVTEAISTDLARADALQENKGYDAVRFFQNALPGEPSRTRKEIEKIAKGENCGEGWIGDSVELEWANVMMYFSRSKAEKFAKADFDKFDKNWLLIYDNWELPAVDESKAATIFHSRLVKLNSRLPFDRIFVECRKNIWQFSLSCFSYSAINDVWSGN